jgi:hypothetical protein
VKRRTFLKGSIAAASGIVILGADGCEPPPITHGSQINTNNTGWRALGLTLADLTPSGSITTSADDDVFENLDVTGTIQIKHDGVTIRGCRVSAPGTTHPIKVNYHAGTTRSSAGVTIEFCELHGPLATGSSAQGVNAIRNVDPDDPVNVVRRCDIHHVANIATISGGWVVEENFGHNEKQFEDAHNDGIQCQKAPPRTTGLPFAVNRNKLVLGAVDGSVYSGNAAVWVNTISGDVGDNEVKDNLLQCADVTVGVKYQGLHPSAPPGNDFVGVSTITGNKFVQGWPPQAPGPEAAFSLSDAGTVVRSGNRFVDVGGNDLGPVPGG